MFPNKSTETEKTIDNCTAVLLYIVQGLCRISPFFFTKLNFKDYLTSELQSIFESFYKCWKIFLILYLVMDIFYTVDIKKNKKPSNRTYFKLIASAYNTGLLSVIL